MVPMLIFVSRQIFCRSSDLMLVLSINTDVHYQEYDSDLITYNVSTMFVRMSNLL